MVEVHRADRQTDMHTRMVSVLSEPSFHLSPAGPRGIIIYSTSIRTASSGSINTNSPSLPEPVIMLHRHLATQWVCGH
jgi:hypothetical protein